MTGYGRGEADYAGAKFTVELTSVNRKQSEIVINLAREFAALEPRIRQAINEKVSRGRTTVSVARQAVATGTRTLSLDTALARSYHETMRTLQQELRVPGEITIASILQAPGVMRSVDDTIDAEGAWPAIEEGLAAALASFVTMREQEGNHLARDLAERIGTVRAHLAEVRVLHPAVTTKYRDALRKRIAEAGVGLALDDERLLKEISIFADRCDISEELTRLQSHLLQFGEHLQKQEPVGRTLEFIAQEISRELNTLGAKANDAAISQHTVACKAELEKIREQIQNLE